MLLAPWTVCLSLWLAVCVVAPSVALGDNIKEIPAELINIFDQKGAAYRQYLEKTETITLPADIVDLTFEAVRQISKHDTIEVSDFTWLFWADKLKYACFNAFRILNPAAAGGEQFKITKTHIQAALEKKPLRIALVECTYIKSHSLKMTCLADKFGFYILHGLSDAVIEKALAIFGEVDMANKKVPADKFSDNIAHSVLMELGIDDGGDLTFEKLKEYLTQESLLDDFRACRDRVQPTEHTSAGTGNINYNNRCLDVKLLEYALQDLTDMQIALLFRVLDKDNDQSINNEELKAFVDISDDARINEIKALFGKDSDSQIKFAEVRTYMRTPTVLYQIQEECTSRYETVFTIVCAMAVLKDLLFDIHEPMLLTMPSIELSIAFEYLDVNEDGLISPHDFQLLKIVHNADFHEATYLRMIDEIDNGGMTGFLELDEFNKYMNLPHMVYGIAGCLLSSKVMITKPDRGRCYVRQTLEMFDSFKFVDKLAWRSWFQYYAGGTYEVHKKHSGLLKKFEKHAEMVKPFLDEFGFGGTQVTRLELSFYAKQKEFSQRMEKNSIVTTQTGRYLSEFQLKCLHEEIIIWLKNELQESDILHFFRRLDSNKDEEIYISDFTSPSTDLRILIKLIDRVQGRVKGEEDQHVDYTEFWLWMHSTNLETTEGEHPHIKDVFNTKCPKQEKGTNLIDCYLSLFMAPRDVLLKSKTIEAELAVEERIRQRQRESGE